MAIIAPFEYELTTRVVFGPGTSRQTGAEAGKLGASRVMLVADPGVERAGLTRGVLESLQASGLEVETFNDVESNPRDTSVDRLAELVREGGFDLFVGVGGGSAIDTAKGAATLVAHGGKSVREYEGAGKVTKPALKVIAIPTTAGTGAEVTGNISVTHTEKHHKMSVGRSALCLPTVAILDPEMLSTLPPFLAAAAGMDALSHAAEGYVSRRASVYTDMLAIRAIELIGESLERFVADRTDLEAAGQMLYASALSAMAITHSGTGNDHALARALGGLYDVHHGLACGVLLAPVMRFNLPVCEQKMRDIARALGERMDGLDLRDAAERAPAAVNGLRERVGLPAGFQDLKATGEQLHAMARVAHASVGPNPRGTSYEDIVALYRQVL